MCSFGPGLQDRVPIASVASVSGECLRLNRRYVICVTDLLACLFGLFVSADRHRVEADGCALPQRAIDDVGDDEEPGERTGAPGAQVYSTCSPPAFLTCRYTLSKCAPCIALEKPPETSFNCSSLSSASFVILSGVAGDFCSSFSSSFSCLLIDVSFRFGVAGVSGCTLSP